MIKATNLIYINGTENNPRNHVKWSKVDLFTTEWLKGVYKGMRLGQAFYNMFDSTGEPFPILFYEKDEDICWGLIWSNYKIWNDDKHKAVSQS